MPSSATLVVDCTAGLMPVPLTLLGQMRAPDNAPDMVTLLHAAEGLVVSTQQSRLVGWLVVGHSLSTCSRVLLCMY